MLLYKSVNIYILAKCFGLIAKKAKWRHKNYSFLLENIVA